jgi:hypothetical protein
MNHTISDEKLNEWIEALSRYEDVYTDNGYLAYRDLEDILNELRTIRGTP